MLWIFTLPRKKKVLKFYDSTLKCKFFSGDKPCSTIDLIELLFFSPGYDYSEGYEYANLPLTQMWTNQYVSRPCDIDLPEHLH